MAFRRSLDRAPDLLDHHLHMMAACMDHPVWRLRDGHMPLPEQQIAPLDGIEIGWIDGLSGAAHLHIGVARKRDARRLQRDLHKAGAVDAKRGFSAPKVGHADHPLRDAHEVPRALPDADEMISENEAAARKLEKPAVGLPDRSHGAGKTELRDRRPLDVGDGIKISQPRAYAMCILLDHSRET